MTGDAMTGDAMTGDAMTGGAMTGGAMTADAMTGGVPHPGGGRIVFAAVAPHGELAIPEACSPESAGLAAATQRGMAELALRFDAASPDAVVVLTPHGVHVESRFAVVTSARAAGSLEEAPQVRLDVPVDRPLGLAVLASLGGAGLPASGVSFGGNDPSEAVFPLDWGSLIPLWYLGGRHDPAVPVVVVAPARELSAEAHVAAGTAIALAVATSGRRVALVASADQAHAHSIDGPYGYDPAAARFDELVVGLIRDDHLDRLPALDPGLIADARPDSWWQMLMLLGALEPDRAHEAAGPGALGPDGAREVAGSGQVAGHRWRPELLSYEVPTYFGMLCAAFEPEPREAP